MGKLITTPYKFEPYGYQLPLWKAMKDKCRYAFIVWHRRAGKEKTCLNYMVDEMMWRKGNYYYLFPTYKQGKKVLWEGIDADEFKHLDHIPKEFRKRIDNSEMTIEMSGIYKRDKNGAVYYDTSEGGSIFRIVGTDEIDSIMGTTPIGCVFSEYALQDPTAWGYIAPILTQNHGWAIFNTTPRGKNHAYDLFRFAQKHPFKLEDTGKKTDKGEIIWRANGGWFSEVLTVEDTKIVPPHLLEQEKERYIAQYGNDALYQQEFMCSFEAAVPGAYYQGEMEKMKKENRITRVAYEPNLPVNTAWDLGMDDAMVIIFFQLFNNEFRVIDFYEMSGEGLRHYKKMLDNKQYSYGKHYLPHDIAVRDMGTGKSRFMTLRNLGVTNMVVVPRLNFEDGIEAVRNTLPKCWIDKDKCERVIEALKGYHREYDEKNYIYKNKPTRDWTTHFADAIRTMSMGVRTQMGKKLKKKNKQPKRIYNPLVGI